MQIINLTPHAISLADADGTIISTFAPSGTVARVTSAPGVELAGFPFPAVSSPTWGEVIGLPDPQEGALFIVSGLVAGRVSRVDVFSPGTGPSDNPVRSEAGQIIAVRRMVQAGGD